MRILITGGAGFIGSHIADVLAADGHSVLLLDAFLPQAHGSGSPPTWVAEHELIRGDVRDGELLSRVLADTGRSSSPTRVQAKSWPATATQ